jgi:hypothetical protein
MARRVARFLASAGSLLVVVAQALDGGTLPAQGVIAAPPAKSYAFLVACAQYDKRELKPLAYTLNDVKDFYKVLVESGVPAENIVLMHDEQPRDLLPESRKIREQFDLLLARAGRNSSLIVALSGHGVQFEGKKSNFFCPLDARLQEPETLIPLDEIYQQLEACVAERKLLLVDACRNDPQSSLGRSRAVVELQSVSRPQEELVPKGIVALFSCSAGQQSFEHPTLKHGVFFHQLLQGWKGAADLNRDLRLTLDEVLNYTKDKTEAFAHIELKSKQIPHLKGDFSGTWDLRELPRLTRTPGFAGAYRIVAGTTAEGQNYTGNVYIKGNPNGVMNMGWFGSNNQLTSSGLGFVQDGRLYVCFSTGSHYGMNLYKIGADGTLQARWTEQSAQGRIGAEVAYGGTPGQLEGNYQVRGSVTKLEGGIYTGSMRIDRYDDTYYVSWRTAGETYYGIGVRHGDTFAVAWGATSNKVFGIAEYDLQGGMAVGRWVQFGQRALTVENLARLEE